MLPHNCSCLLLPVFVAISACLPVSAATNTDAEGRLWGWENSGGQYSSCTYKTLIRTPVYLSWSSAPVCNGEPTTSNSVYDRSGRLWGWDSTEGGSGRSCSFRGTRMQQPGEPGKPVLTWSTAPACTQPPTTKNSVKTRAGELWGWEPGLGSCAHRINNNGDAPRCKGLANYYNSVRDSLGRPWGWDPELASSCRYF